MSNTNPTKVKIKEINLFGTTYELDIPDDVVKNKITVNENLIIGAGGHIKNEGSIVGIHGYYYTDINLNTKQIRLSTLNTNTSLSGKNLSSSELVPNQDINIQDIEEGWEFTLVNDTHHVGYAKVKQVENDILTFEYLDDSKPFTFTEIRNYTGDNIHGMTWMLYFPEHPEVGPASVGNNARAFGEQTKAFASNSTAEGKYTRALGNGSRATGKETIAAGNYSTTGGFQTKALGHQSFAIGKLTIAEGNSSFATGSGSKALGNYAFVSGCDTEAAEVAVAFGYKTKALSPYSFAEGFETCVEIDTEATVLSRGAHVEGAGSIARGYAAHAQGISTQAIAQGAHAGGRNSIAQGKYSFASGDDVQANGTASFAIGEGTVAHSRGAFVGGYGAQAFGRESFAFGHNAKANGDAASIANNFALGYNAVAGEQFSAAIGRNAKTTHKYQTAVGVNNFPDENMLFMVGNGIGTDGQLTSRSNAFVVYQDGETCGGTLRLTNTSSDSNKIGTNDITNIIGLRDTFIKTRNNVELQSDSGDKGSASTKISATGADGASGGLITTSYAEIRNDGITLKGEAYDGSGPDTITLGLGLNLRSYQNAKLDVAGDIRLTPAEGCEVVLDKNTSITGDLSTTGNIVLGGITLTPAKLQKLLDFIDTIAD